MISKPGFIEDWPELNAETRARAEWLTVFFNYYYYFQADPKSSLLTDLRWSFRVWLLVAHVLQEDSGEPCSSLVGFMSVCPVCLLLFIYLCGALVPLLQKQMTEPQKTIYHFKNPGHYFFRIKVLGTFAGKTSETFFIHSRLIYMELYQDTQRRYRVRSDSQTYQHSLALTSPLPAPMQGHGGVQVGVHPGMVTSPHEDKTTTHRQTDTHIHT